MVPKAGGFYVYAERAFGRYGGFVVGWSDWLNNAMGLSFISIVFGEYASKLFAPNLSGGRVIVSGACAQAVTTGSGVLYNLTFNVIGSVNQTSSLSFTNPANNTNTLQFNNGTPTVTTANGQFTVLGPTAADVSVSGRVLTASGRGIRNVRITLTDSSGNTKTAVSTTFGYYRFDNVTAGETYIITAKGKRYEFSPPAQVINVNEDAVDINFTANLLSRVM